MWSVWKVRNELKFNGIRPEWGEVIELIKVRVAIWVKYNHKSMVYSVNDIVGNLGAVRDCCL